MRTFNYCIYSLLMMIISAPLPSFARQAPWVGKDLNGINCSGSDTKKWYGPFDYTISNEKAKLKIVEDYHFTSDVENHIRGSTGYLSGDLNYTLMAGPNHHRALWSIILLQMKLDKKIISFQDKGNLLTTPVECYLNRAIYFSPADAQAYAYYGYFLKIKNRLEEAKKYYKKAFELKPNSAKIAYSYSLILLELKEYDKALEYAKLAYKNKKTPPGLRNKLKAMGKWSDN